MNAARAKVRKSMGSLDYKLETRAHSHAEREYKLAWGFSARAAAQRTQISEVLLCLL